tara:strand:- start:21 stop:263 length:243 start_codon:yes stop_codon:yes gene_type:complete
LQKVANLFSASIVTIVRHVNRVGKNTCLPKNIKIIVSLLFQKVAKKLQIQHLNVNIVIKYIKVELHYGGIEKNVKNRMIL